MEALSAFRERMSAQQQDEFFTVIQSELNYFSRLLEDLFFIADIAEPSYKTILQSIDIVALIETELQARQLTRPNLQWIFQRASSSETVIAGDKHLLHRLIRNTFDNAAKYAKSVIAIAIAENKDFFEFSVTNDGDGMDEDAINAFGTRRKHRVQSGVNEPNLSLGLGSVIIKTIVELHGAGLRIESSAAGNSHISGTRFIFFLPRLNDVLSK